LTRNSIFESSQSIDTEPSSPLSKVFKVLETMAREGSPMGLQNLAAAMGMPKTSVHRITTQLEELGYIQREPGTRQLVVAPALVDLAVDIISASARQSDRHAILQSLAERIGQSVVIGIRVGNEIVYLDDATNSGSAFTLRFRKGLRAPLHCTSQGKLYLSRMPEAEWDRYIGSATLERYTNYTITDSETLRATLEEIKHNDFAISIEEFVRGIVGAAVPVPGARRRILATLSFAAPASQMSYDDIIRLRPMLEESAAQLALTYSDQEDQPAEGGD
jgi:IclR family transcriptional regulator, acetate operon repressor